MGGKRKRETEKTLPDKQQPMLTPDLHTRTHTEIHMPTCVHVPCTHNAKKKKANSNENPTDWPPWKEILLPHSQKS